MDEGGVPEAGLVCKRCGWGVPAAKSWVGEEAIVDGVAAETGGGVNTIVVVVVVVAIAVRDERFGLGGFVGVTNDFWWEVKSSDGKGG